MCELSTVHARAITQVLFQRRSVMVCLLLAVRARDLALGPQGNRARKRGAREESGLLTNRRGAKYFHAIKLHRWFLNDTVRPAAILNWRGRLNDDSMTSQLLLILVGPIHEFSVRLDAFFRLPPRRALLLMSSLLRDHVGCFTTEGRPPPIAVNGSVPCRPPPHPLRGRKCSAHGLKVRSYARDLQGSPLGRFLVT
jgi:hypothetical protein